MKESRIKFENVLILIIIILSYSCIAYAYHVTSDTTIKGVLIGAVIGTLNTTINFRFGSSKSSANKDETIASMQDNISNPTPTVKAEVVNTDNVETVNTNSTNINNKDA